MDLQVNPSIRKIIREIFFRRNRSCDLCAHSHSGICESCVLDKTFLVGFSGGLDSTVLLHALAQIRSEFPLKIRAVYVNHGLSPNAKLWAEHCEQICKKLDAEFVVQTLDNLANDGSSPEDRARISRYAAFATLLNPEDVLLTAHHQDDQAETVLLQLLRGAGPKGLAAMPQIKPFSQGFHARPFLQITRDELKEYAVQHALKWIDDESNDNKNFTRNFLRHDILPLLKQRWPSVTNTLSRVAENCAETQYVVDAFVAEKLSAVQGSEIHTLSVKKLLELDAVFQRHVLRAWLNQLNFPIPPAIKLQQIQHDMLNAREDKAPHFAWRGIELRRYRDNLYAMPILAPQSTEKVLQWDFAAPLLLSDAEMLHAELQSEQGLRSDIPSVEIRFRQSGEKLQLPGRPHRHSLKKLFQEWGIPPWLRERMPLIYVDNQLAAVPGYYVHDAFAAGVGEKGYKVILKSVFEFG